MKKSCVMLLFLVWVGSVAPHTAVSLKDSVASDALAASITTELGIPADVTFFAHRSPELFNNFVQLFELLKEPKYDALRAEFIRVHRPLFVAKPLLSDAAYRKQVQGFTVALGERFRDVPLALKEIIVAFNSEIQMHSVPRKGRLSWRQWALIAGGLVALAAGGYLLHNGGLTKGSSTKPIVGGEGVITEQSRTERSQDRGDAGPQRIEGNPAGGDSSKDGEKDKVPADGIPGAAGAAAIKPVKIGPDLVGSLRNAAGAVGTRYTALQAEHKRRLAEGKVDTPTELLAAGTELGVAAANVCLEKTKDLSRGVAAGFTAAAQPVVDKLAPVVAAAKILADMASETLSDAACVAIGGTIKAGEHGYKKAKDAVGVVANGVSAGGRRARAAMRRAAVVGGRVKDTTVAVAGAAYTKAADTCAAIGRLPETIGNTELPAGMRGYVKDDITTVGGLLRPVPVEDQSSDEEDGPSVWDEVCGVHPDDDRPLYQQHGWFGHRPSDEYLAMNEELAGLGAVHDDRWVWQRRGWFGNKSHADYIAEREDAFATEQKGAASGPDAAVATDDAQAKAASGRAVTPVGGSPDGRGGGVISSDDDSQDGSNDESGD